MAATIRTSKEFKQVRRALKKKSPLELERIPMETRRFDKKGKVTLSS